MTDQQKTRPRYPGILAVFAIVGPLLQVAVQTVAGLNDGFELVNWIVIVLGVSISVAALVFYVLGRGHHRR